MPICIECRYPVTQLYTIYSKADDRSLGKGVRLTQCPRCRRFADKYVEHDFVVLFIDLVLIKPQVYRHLLFNRLGRDDDGFDPSIVRLGILLLLFDVYLTWARIEKDAPGTHSATSVLSSHSVLTQYLFFLALCSLETLAFHLPIRLLTSMRSSPISPGVGQTQSHGVPQTATTSPSLAAQYHPSRLLLPASTPRPYPHPNHISTALFVSSCTKLFPILMVIWDYDLPSSASAVSWAVIINNIAALEILLDCGYFRAMILAMVGAAGRWAVGWWLLRCVGLAHAGWTGFAEWGAGAVGLGSITGYIGSVT